MGAVNPIEREKPQSKNSKRIASIQTAALWPSQQRRETHIRNLSATTPGFSLNRRLDTGSVPRRLAIRRRQESSLLFLPGRPGYQPHCDQGMITLIQTIGHLSRSFETP